MLRVAVCAPLAPALICGFEQVVPAGNPLHEKVTGLGKVVEPIGVTVKLYTAVCPAATVCVTVVSAIVKVKRELNDAVAECAMCDASVPVPLMLKL
jgi:hypothetical protein